MADIIFAQKRFGLGPRGDRPVSGDGRDWVLGQIGRTPPRMLYPVPDRTQATAELNAALDEGRMARKVKKAMAGEPAMAPDQAMAAAGVERVREKQKIRRGSYARAADARLANALDTQTPFLERMVHFWTNHFAVSAKSAYVLGYAGLLEEEAIRPHVLGTFGSMLNAVERHPAMIYFLDQQNSLGPGSPIAARAAMRGNKRGINENLAREILELHTLGVRSGYSQADVTEFAKALTGWTVSGIHSGVVQRIKDGPPGLFAFAGEMHEPGARQMFGRSFADNGEGQAAAVLNMLAVDPRTARHIATKLARHFAADDPPPAMVARIERAFLASGGDLPTVYRAVVNSPEAWNPASPKFRSPWDWGVAGLRAIAPQPQLTNIFADWMDDLGQPTWKPPSPAGWDDITTAWAGPDALYRRVQIAQTVGSAAGDTRDARLLAPKVLGAGLSDKTATAISRAESPKSALALLLAAPEMLRR